MPESSSTADQSDRVIPCPLCAKAVAGPGQPHPDFPGSSIHECRDCGYWFAYPVPSAAALEDYYRTAYAQRRTWRNSIEYLTLMERRAAAQREFIGAELTAIRRALDIGCGVGALVAELQRSGIEAVGYDSDESVVRIGRDRWGANVHARHYTRAEATGPYDLLCLSHVVEHLAHPVADLREFALNVRPGGWLLVEVPQCIPWMFEQGVATESHLSFFTVHALGRLAAAAGLEVVRLHDCGPAIVEHYQAQRRREPPPSFGTRIGRAIGTRLRRVGGRIAPQLWPVRTEYDGFFGQIHATGTERGMWLRVLLRRPVAPV